LRFIAFNLPDCGWWDAAGTSNPSTIALLGIFMGMKVRGLIGSVYGFIMDTAVFVAGCVLFGFGILADVLLRRR
jgi:hypothetical protein